jgi:hypothetical protein
VLHEREPGKGYDREAYDYAEKSKARALLDILAESAAGITRGLTPAQSREQAELHAAVSAASSALLKGASEQNKRALGKRRVAAGPVGRRYPDHQPKVCRAPVSGTVRTEPRAKGAGGPRYRRSPVRAR